MWAALCGVLADMPLSYIGCILLGIPVGYALRRRPMAVRTVGGTASGIIYALLFLLGVSLGRNKELLHRLGELGLQGLSIGLACALGSVLVVRLLATTLLRVPDGEKRS